MKEQINESKNPRSMIYSFDWVLISEKKFVNGFFQKNKERVSEWVNAWVDGMNR